MDDIRLIDANALKKDLSEFNYDMALRIVDTQSTVEAEPVRHGRWLLKPHEHAPAKEFICSECGNVSEHKYYSESGYYSYCKDCGAKMDASPETVQNKE
jgi:hypothetical protein